MALNCDNNVGCSWSFNSVDKGLGNMIYEAKEKSELGGSGKVIDSNDILDELPADPFGMDIESTFTALTGWLQDFEIDFESDFWRCGAIDDHDDDDESEEIIGDHKFFSGLNLVWNGTMRFQQEKGKLMVDEISIPYTSFNQYGFDSGVYDAGVPFDGNLNNGVVSDKAKGVFSDCAEGGAPHDGLYFALGYLGVKDLLVVERVCSSLRDAVRTDPLLWRSIHIDKPLSAKITDDSLVRLTKRAQGTLQCLSLVECFRITDSGLKHALESNPRLTKLSVPGCVKLSVEGVLFNLRALKSAGTLRIKHLRIGGLLGITVKQFEELKSLLGADDQVQMRAHKPQFYRGGQFYVSCDDDRSIDIEACPNCQKLGLVYDCPTESCQAKHQATTQLCRACTLCISRCICCGRCIKDCDYEETFCLDMLCLDCLKQLLISQEKQEVKGASSSKRTIFCQETRYKFCFIG